MQLERTKTPSALAGTTPITQLAGEKRLGKEDFLKLLVTQLRHQDPMEPMKNEQFVAQTAQFSTLEQMQAVNENIKAQSQIHRSVANATTVQYIGKFIKAPGAKIEVTNGIATQFGAELPQEANVQIEVYNNQNVPISTIRLGTQPAGMVNANWNALDRNGQALPDGTYSFKVLSRNNADEPIEAIPIMSGKVSGVQRDQNELFLAVHGKKVSVANVIATSLTSNFAQ